MMDVSEVALCKKVSRMEMDSSRDLPVICVSVMCEGGGEGSENSQNRFNQP